MDFGTRGKSHDIIDLSGLNAVSDFKDLKADHFADHDGDLWIDVGKDVLIIKGVDMKELSAADFHF